MRTKMPLELVLRDRLVVRTGRRTDALAVTAFARDDDGLHVQLEDGTQVAITDLTTPVELAP